MEHGLSEIAVVAPAEWPGRVRSGVQPGDLSRFAPQGMGLGVPMVMHPWDTPAAVMGRGGYYGTQAAAFHPLRDAPRTEPRGGTVYFDGGIVREDFDAMLRITGAWAPAEYAVFVAESPNPEADGYLVQVRVAGRGAVEGMYGAERTPDTAQYFRQPHAFQDFAWRFVENQRERWGSGYSFELSGLFGGDGDWAKEELCFGFLVENAYNHIFRLWSRAWLVTK